MRNVQFNVQLTSQLREAVGRLALDEGYSFSAAARRVLAIGLITLKSTDTEFQAEFGELLKFTAKNGATRSKLGQLTRKNHERSAA